MPWESWRLNGPHLVELEAVHILTGIPPMGLWQLHPLTVLSSPLHRLPLLIQKDRTHKRAEQTRVWRAVPMQSCQVGTFVVFRPICCFFHFEVLSAQYPSGMSAFKINVAHDAVRLTSFKACVFEHHISYKCLHPWQMMFSSLTPHPNDVFIHDRFTRGACCGSKGETKGRRASVWPPVPRHCQRELHSANAVQKQALLCAWSSKEASFLGKITLSMETKFSTCSKLYACTQIKNYFDELWIQNGKLSSYQLAWSTYLAFIWPCTSVTA
jgi:hypothetical protein